jgi:hypothetical protein
MAWDLEHPETVGVEDGTRLPLRQRMLPDGRKMMIYAALALVPILIFCLMIVLAKR